MFHILVCYIGLSLITYCRVVATLNKLSLAQLCFLLFVMLPGIGFTHVSYRHISAGYFHSSDMVYILVYIQVKPNILVKRLRLAPGEPFLNFGRVPQGPTKFDSWRGGILLFYINIYAMAKFIGPAWVL